MVRFFRKLRLRLAGLLLGNLVYYHTNSDMYMDLDRRNKVPLGTAASHSLMRILIEQGGDYLESNVDNMALYDTDYGAFRVIVEKLDA